jgi:hypothetical protein
MLTSAAAINAINLVLLSILTSLVQSVLVIGTTPRVPEEVKNCL